MADLTSSSPIDLVQSSRAIVHRGPKPRRILTARNIVLYGTLTIIAIYYLVPLYVMIVTSLKTMEEIRNTGIFAWPAFPRGTEMVLRDAQMVEEPVTLFKYWHEAMWTRCTGITCEGLSKGFWNSVTITIPSVIVSIAIASVNGYALAMWPFRGAMVLFTILVFGSFIPYQVMLYPLTLGMKGLGDAASWISQLFGGGKVKIFGTVWSLVIIHTIFGMPLLTLLFRNYFSTIPKELYNAARVDGAGFWGIYFRIMMPMSLPIFAVATILQVTGIWNDFLFGVVFTKADTYPMTVQLNNIVNSAQGEKVYNINMAATILTALVPLTVYFVSGKMFVRGIAAGAVKG